MTEAVSTGRLGLIPVAPASHPFIAGIADNQRGVVHHERIRLLRHRHTGKPQ